MCQISSKLTWWHKRAFPTFWFGFLALFTLNWIPSVVRGEAPAATLAIPLGMAAFGAVLMCWLVFPLVDKVWIDGDELVVRNHGQMDRFPIANVVDVDGSYMANPESIGLYLNTPCRFGKTIRFAAPFRLFMFGTHPLAQELIDRSGCFERRRANAPQ